MLRDMWTLIGQKMVENAKVEKFKWYNLGDFQIAWSILRLVVKSSITRHGNFKRTKSSNKTIWVIFKQRGVAKIIFGIFATTLEHFLSVCINATIINRFSSAWRGLHRASLTFRCKMQFIFTLETSTADGFFD